MALPQRSLLTPTCPILAELNYNGFVTFDTCVLCTRIQGLLPNITIQYQVGYISFYVDETCIILFYQHYYKIFIVVTLFLDELRF